MYFGIEKRRTLSGTEIPDTVYAVNNIYLEGVRIAAVCDLKEDKVARIQDWVVKASNSSRSAKSAQSLAICASRVSSTYWRIEMSRYAAIKRRRRLMSLLRSIVNRLRGLRACAF